MPAIQFDRYYRYEELTQLLRAYTQEFPQLVQMESLGRSYEGRDIWVMTITNSATGAANEKPALWADGNIHASEVSASTACLYLLHKLTMAYGKDADITRCLDTRAFYICPRLNPDGAEWALADKPKIIRSSTRPYPYDEEPLGGLEAEDVDGDGRMLFMRIPDPNGAWKAYPYAPRLLVRRDPTESGGTYYRVLPEGFIKDFDGVLIQARPRKQQLDLNRNFPSNWRQENEQRGAGPFPTSEPEVHAAVQFIVDHPNITGGLTFHTFSGVLLRPYGTQPDDQMPAEDLWTFQKIGQKGTEITGYPNISVFHDFRYHPKEVITGVFDDWLYDNRGVYAWTVEIWSPLRQAGVEVARPMDWMRNHPIEDDLKMLQWSDEKLDGRGYVDWYEFDHPQLGRVELGGWDNLFAWRNPPPAFLEREVAPLADWAIWHLLISPRLEAHDLSVTPLGDGLYHVRLVVQNTGWLPTYISKKALEKKAVRGVIVEIALPEGAALRMGKAREELSQLEGRAYHNPTVIPWDQSGYTSDRAKVEWVIHAPAGGTAQLTARHDRAGVVRLEIEFTA
jgi:murein tripeptide amidase MpaA